MNLTGDNWADGPFAPFDVESTSPDSEEARIVTACVGMVGAGHESRFKTWLVSPGIDIPEAATAIHGVSTEQAKADGEPPEKALADIQARLDNAWQQRIPVVGHNLAYDFTVLDRDLRRSGLPGLEIRGPALDSFVLDRALDKYRKGKRTLTATCQHYGVQLEGAHDATADATAATRLVWKLARIYPQIAAMSLRQLMEFQAAAHRERQEDFARYLQREGKDASDVSADWPIRPLVAAVAP